MSKAQQQNFEIEGDTLNAIYERAATFDELLSDDFESRPGQKANSDRAALRLAAWCRSSVSGDWSLFQQRLTRDNLTFGFVLSRFSEAVVKENAIFPMWVHDSAWIKPLLCDVSPAVIFNKDLDGICPIAFGDLFYSLLDAASAKLNESVSLSAKSRISDTALESLLANLGEQISELVSPALFEQFVQFRSRHDGEPSPSQISSVHYYERYIQEMRRVGLRKLLDDKPVLLRLIATIVRQWLETTSELLTRLDLDLQEIKRRFFSSALLGTVTDIQGGLSDPHNSGHCVLILTFESGQSIVYKPKDCRLDAIWYELVQRLNQHNPPCSLRAANVLERGSYGWSECIGDPDCEDLKDVELYFERCGAWLILFHLLCGSDMHDENILADASHPIPIDIENILQGSNPAIEDQVLERKSRALANIKAFESVLTVGLLPQYVRRPDNTVIGIGGMNPRINDKFERIWINVNTDSMEMQKVKADPGEVANMPHLYGEAAKLNDHLEKFITGFEKYADFLILLRERYGSDLFLAGFQGLSTRKIVRPTAFYYALLQRVRDHRNMQDSVLWSVELDFVARFSNWEKSQEVLWPVLAEERRALAELNVPVFYAGTSQDSLTTYGQLNIQSGATPGLPRSRIRIDAFNTEDKHWQLQVIRASTAHMLQDMREDVSTPSTSEQNVEFDTPEFFIDAAKEVAKQIQVLAITSNNNTTWIGLDFMGDASVGQLTPLGFDLYNGNAGIALFLAAMSKQPNCSGFSDLAMSALAGIRYEIHGLNATRFARTIGIGGATGLGSIIYALTTASKLLESRDLLEDAKAAVRLLTDELIKSDKNLDVLGGCAGAILGILRLHKESPDPWILERAIYCGEYLLSIGRVNVNGKLSWSSLGLSSQPLNGMSHGAAGFALALSALGALTNRSDFLEAAEACIEFENSSFSSNELNWPDFRDGFPMAKRFETCQWCNGAIGIGLARIATLRQGGLNASELKVDIEYAVKGAQRHPWGSIDSLCCGTAGGVEFFSEASILFKENELSRQALLALTRVIRRAQETGTYQFGGSGGVFNLGLFRGLAGLGYTALRRVDPSLPNVLIWE